MTAWKPWRGRPARIRPSGPPVTRLKNSGCGGRGGPRPPLPPAPTMPVVVRTPRGQWGVRVRCSERRARRAHLVWCGGESPARHWRSVHTVGFTLDHGILLFACTGVQISMSPSGIGGGDCGLTVVPGCVPNGVSTPIPVHGADSGCEMCPSSHPQMDSSSSWSDSSSPVGGGSGGGYPPAVYSRSGTSLAAGQP